MCFIYKYGTYIQLSNNQQFSITLSSPFFMSGSILLYFDTCLCYIKCIFYINIFILTIYYY